MTNPERDGPAWGLGHVALWAKEQRLGPENEREGGRYLSTRPLALSAIHPPALCIPSLQSKPTLSRKLLYPHFNPYPPPHAQPTFKMQFQTLSAFLAAAAFANAQVGDIATSAVGGAGSIAESVTDAVGGAGSTGVAGASSVFVPSGTGSTMSGSATTTVTSDITATQTTFTGSVTLSSGSNSGSVTQPKPTGNTEPTTIVGSGGTATVLNPTTTESETAAASQATEDPENAAPAATPFVGGLFAAGLVAAAML